MAAIKLKHRLAAKHFDWIYKNVGPNTYYLHTQEGGVGWRYRTRENILELEDDKWATLWYLRWGEN